MSAAGAVKRAVRGRGGRAKAVEAAQKLSSKKQLTDNIESHLSHTSLSYASDPSAIISKMKKIAGEKTPLRVPKVPKTPKQEEQQLVRSLDYLHLLHSKRVPRPAGSEVAHIKEPNLQEAVTNDVSPEKWRQREEFTKRVKDELHGKKAPATVITDSEQKQIDKLIEDIKHPTEVKEPSAAQAVVKEAPELEQASAITGGNDVRTTKSGGMGGAQTTQKKVQIYDMIPKKPAGTDGAQTPQRRVQIHDMIPKKPAGTDVPAEKQALQSGGKYDPTKFMEMAEDNNLGRSERQMLERLGNMRANAQKVFDKGTDEQIKNELGHWGIEAEDGATTSDYMNKIDEMLKEKAESGPTIGDKFRAHHGVGLTGLGVVGVSTLDLANSRGQQSNAQLYSDPFA